MNTRLPPTAEILDVQAERLSERTAISRLDEHISFLEWRERAHAVARGLAEIGVEDGEFVALRFLDDDWIEFAVTFFGVVTLGAIPVLLPPTPPSVLELVPASLAVTITNSGSNANPRDVMASELETIGLTARLRTKRIRRPQPNRQRLDLPLDVVFTSATTGHPKPLMFRHGHWVDPLGSRSPKYPLAVVHAGIPLFTSTGAHGIMLAHLTRGLESVVCTDAPSFASAFAESLARCHPVEAALTPHSANRLVETIGDGLSFSTVRVIKIVAGQLSAVTASGLHSLFPKARVVSLYGLTEGGGSLLGRVYDPQQPAALGYPLGTTEIRIYDPDTNQPVATGESGILFVRQPSLTPPVNFAQPVGVGEVDLESRWVRTGDFVYKDRDGCIHLLGREKDLIIDAAGQRAHASELEASLRDVPNIADASVVDLATGDGSEPIVAAIVLSDTDVPLGQVEAQVSHIKSSYPKFRLVVLSDFPRTALGKVAKWQLINQLRDRDRLDATPSADDRVEHGPRGYRRPRP